MQSKLWGQNMVSVVGEVTSLLEHLSPPQPLSYNWNIKDRICIVLLLKCKVINGVSNWKNHLKEGRKSFI